jgi:5-methyltetrahydropteroyltriglutamate--homocysteine methyltransferase
MKTPFPKATILGYPRIGKNRELKKAVESFWAGKTDLDQLKTSAKELRAQTYQNLEALGLNKDDWSIPMNFSYYDQMLDMATTFGIIPKRFESLRNINATKFSTGSESSSRAVGSFGEKFRRPTGFDELDLNAYFTVARGDKSQGEDGLPGEMTKWFNTNYHYIVPEFHKDTSISLANFEVLRQFKEALASGYNVRPVLVGPATLLALGKYEPGLSPEDFVPDLLSAYARLLGLLASAGCKWVQFDEPAFISENLDFEQKRIFDIAGKCYHEFNKLSVNSSERPAILVTTPYANIGQYLDVYQKLEVEALHFDLVSGALPAPSELKLSNSQTFVAGAINGRNIWRTNYEELTDLTAFLRNLENQGIGVTIATSTSLQHVPHSISQDDEPWLNLNRPELVSNLSFANEKVNEVIELSKYLEDQSFKSTRTKCLPFRHQNLNVQKALQEIKPTDFERESIEDRKNAQAKVLNLPLLPTTTIGSFPQTQEIRKARADYRKGLITKGQYIDAMKQEIKQCVELQEKIGLDVLVHGEAERNDMVQYFAENFDGCDVTQNGWVQSYGSRCTKPSLIWGDVSRPKPFSVEWSVFAQSLTDKPMKGMLTGPVTILAWSFVRDDQPLAITANQVALALRDEITDLENAGIGVIQVDEPALRELLPLKKTDHQDYLSWSVQSFRLATSSVKVETQIHTHLCYSEFEIILPAIIGLNADVTSIEAARSKMEIVKGIVEAKYPLAIGPGVYDIHSPRIPEEREIENLLFFATAEFTKGGLNLSDLWVNPDCGLKTRRNEEATQSLINLVRATQKVRDNY